MCGQGRAICKERNRTCRSPEEGPCMTDVKSPEWQKQREKGVNNRRYEKRGNVWGQIK